jgi:pimeloyl-ACP methyl ester carboxylesterase
MTTNPADSSPQPPAAIRPVRPASTTPTPTPTPTPPPDPAPTVSLVLIHGGSTTGRYWDLVTAALVHPSVAVDLPGRGTHPADLLTVTLDDAVASVTEDAEALGTDVVLVAHSSGGLVVPGVVAALGDRVRHVVLNAASIPPEGGRGLDCMRSRHRERTEEALALRDADRAMTTPTDPPDREQLRHGYGTELNDAQIDYVRDHVRFVRDTFNFFDAPVFWSHASQVPVTYVLNLRDRSVPLALQREMMTRLPTPPIVVPLDTGHIPAVTMPTVLAALLDGCAAQYERV